MAAEPLFIDSGGFYALVSAESASHADAVAIMEESRRVRRRAVTTDYVLDETATLLRARGLTKQLKEFLRLTEASQALSIEWMTPDRFAAARTFMLKHLDQEFSFTDCASFVVMKETGAAADDVTDDKIREAIKLLAETEGIFAETAGGVTVGVAKKLIDSGKISRDDSAVLCVTGNGLKTLVAVAGHVGKPREIKPSLREFEALLAHEEKVNA